MKPRPTEALPLDEVTWLLNRRKAAVTRKQMWGNLFQKTYRLSQPNRNVFDMRPIGANPGTYNVEGMDIAWYVFDLTLAHATDTWVNEIVTALCPKGKKWLKFIAGSEIPKDQVDEVNKKLQERTDLFFKYLNKSNFQDIVHECFFDTAVSTGFMTINPGSVDKPWIFASNPPDCVYAEEGPYGTFDAYYRDHTRMHLDHAKVMWPGFKEPTNLARDSNDALTITVYEIMFYDYRKKTWEYRIIHSDTETLCYQRTQRFSNFIGWRVKKLAGETYGRGPAMDAVAAAGTINQALYDEIVSANFRALPMYMGFDDGVFNPYNFKMVPNTVLACSPTASGTWPLQPVPAAGDIQWGMLVLDELRQQVNNIMATNPLPAVDDPKATATEILKRDQRNREMRSAKDSRIQNEFFEPLVNTCIEILMQFGLWDDIKVDGEIIDIHFDTPLAISQGQEEVIELRSHIEFLQGLYGPEATSAFYHNEKISPWAARMLNVNLEMIKNEEQLIEVFAAMEEQKQAMAQQQEAAAQQ